MVRRLALPLLLAAALLVVAIPALAGAKPAVTPQAGKYKGPSESAGLPYPAQATVKAKGGKTVVSLVNLQASYTCAGGGNYQLLLNLEAPLKGTTFAAAGKVDDPIYGEYSYRLKGKFTKSTAFEGSVVAEGESTVAGPAEKCSTGSVTFKLQKTK